jgi:hypothetical protein
MTQGVRNADYFMANLDQYDALTPAEQMELLNNGQLTIAETDKPEDQPAAIVDDKGDEGSLSNKVEDEPAASEAQPEGILSKDGKHIIPFERLTAAQDEANRLRTLSEQQAQLIASLTETKAALEAAKVEDAENGGGTQAQEDVLAALKEEYPELAETLTPAISKLVEQGIAKTVEALEAKFDSAMKPLQETAKLSAEELHFKAIKEAHSDLEELLKGDAVDKWVEKQPAFVRGRYQEVLEKGTANEVIELVKAYKDANPAQEVTLTKEQLQAQAKAVIDKAKDTKAPLSLSDIPAGTAAAGNEASAMLEMSPMALMKQFEGKTPEQIDALMSKII